MLDLNLQVPKASRYVSHDTVDRIALEANRAYRTRSDNKNGFPVDMELFVDLIEVSLVWDAIEEPDGATFFGSFCADDGGLITINERHRELFESRLDVFGACLGHESGHCVLRHWEKALSSASMPSLFGESASAPQLFHKSAWYQYGLTREEVQKSKERERNFKEALTKNALISETARQTLAQMENRFEPEWMFRQAEHFSLCLRIPRDALLAQLEEGWNFNTWAPFYRLAERFGVSASMMRARLEKLGVIEIGSDGRPSPKATQAGLFSWS